MLRYSSRIWRIIITVLFSMVLIGSLAWIMNLLSKPDVWPIRNVQIEGDYRYLEPQSLEQTLLPLVTQNFFRVDVKALQRALLALPWVAQASVRRVWPDELSVNVIEQEPVAFWNDDALFNLDGQLFYPSLNTTILNLPHLNGPEEQSKQIFDEYQDMNLLLTNTGMMITRFTLSERQARQLALSNGMILNLGREDVLGRLQRFVGFIPQITQVEQETTYVDLRYTNGIAVGH